MMIFGADLSWSVHAHNKNKDILIIDVGPTQWLDNTILAAEKEYALKWGE